MPFLDDDHHCREVVDLTVASLSAPSVEHLDALTEFHEAVDECMSCLRARYKGAVKSAVAAEVGAVSRCSPVARVSRRLTFVVVQVAALSVGVDAATHPCTQCKECLKPSSAILSPYKRRCLRVRAFAAAVSGNMGGQLASASRSAFLWFVMSCMSPGLTWTTVCVVV